MPAPLHVLPEFPPAFNVYYTYVHTPIIHILTAIMEGENDLHTDVEGDVSHFSHNPVAPQTF